MYSVFKELCEKYNKTAYRVAKDTGISTATLSDWKTGKSVPKTDKLQKIADYFGVPLDVFTSDTVAGHAKKVPRLQVTFDKQKITEEVMKVLNNTLPDQPSGYPVYYTDQETADLAQAMLEDRDMRALYHMKRNTEPEKFKAHINMMKQIYKLEHPEEYPEDFE